MIEVLLIRPGSTTFDREGRIKGSLDIPLSPEGEEQAEALSRSLAEIKMDCLYVSPCESARKSAERIAARNFCKHKVLECLRNLDHGLWQGKLVSEVRRLQPKVYRQFQEHPKDVCPPGGETVQAAYERIQPMVEKLKKRHNGSRFGLLVPAPMAAIARCAFVGGSLGDLWKSELDFGTFEVLSVEPNLALASLSMFATATA